VKKTPSPLIQKTLQFCIWMTLWITQVT